MLHFRGLFSINIVLRMLLSISLDTLFPLHFQFSYPKGFVRRNIFAKETFRLSNYDSVFLTFFGEIKLNQSNNDSLRPKFQYPKLTK